MSMAVVVAVVATEVESNASCCESDSVAFVEPFSLVSVLAIGYRERRGREGLGQGFRGKWK